MPQDDKLNMRVWETAYRFHDLTAIPSDRISAAIYAALDQLHEEELRQRARTDDLVSALAHSLATGGPYQPEEDESPTEAEQIVEKSIISSFMDSLFQAPKIVPADPADLMGTRISELPGKKVIVVTTPGSGSDWVKALIEKNGFEREPVLHPNECVLSGEEEEKPTSLAQADLSSLEKRILGREYPVKGLKMSVDHGSGFKEFMDYCKADAEASMGVPGDALGANPTSFESFRQRLVDALEEEAAAEQADVGRNLLSQNIEASERGECESSLAIVAAKALLAGEDPFEAVEEYHEEEKSIRRAEAVEQAFGCGYVAVRINHGEEVGFFLSQTMFGAINLGTSVMGIEDQRYELRSLSEEETYGQLWIADYVVVDRYEADETPLDELL